jgi:hypothetical protein
VLGPSLSLQATTQQCQVLRKSSVNQVLVPAKSWETSVAAWGTKKLVIFVVGFLGVTSISIMAAPKQNNKHNNSTGGE